MSDTINKQAAVDVIRKCNVKEVTPAYMLIDKAEAMMELMMLPSAQPRKKGKWTATYSDCDGDVWVSWKCSNCGYVRKKGWKYTDDGKKPDALFCEMCNADMRGEQE